MAKTTYSAQLEQERDAALLMKYGTTSQWDNAPSYDGAELRKFEYSAASEMQMLSHPAKTASHMDFVRHLESSGSVQSMRVATPEIQSMRMDVQHPRIPVKRGALKDDLQDPADPSTTYVLLAAVALLFIGAATIVSIQ